MVLRTVLPGLVLAALIGGSVAAETRRDAGRAERLAPKRWVSMVVTRITRAGETGEAVPAGTVTIRIRVGADGSLEAAAIDESSGSASLDDRALRAAKAAAPFSPPPNALLTLEGFTELSFPVEFERARDR